MQESTFELLQHARRNSRSIEKRKKILSDTVRELRKYHDKAGKQKQTVIMRLIVRYEDCINSLI